MHNILDIQEHIIKHTAGNMLTAIASKIMDSIIATHSIASNITDTTTATIVTASNCSKDMLQDWLHIRNLFVTQRKIIKSSVKSSFFI